MKRILIAALALAILLGLAVASASAGDWWFATADLGNDDLTGGGYCWSFNAEVSGGWGGEFGEGAVTAFPGDDDPAGYCTFNAKGNVSKIELRVLDGIADDSFEVYVMNPAGKEWMVFNYEDQGTTETWNIHTIEGEFLNYGTIIKIVPANVGWSGFDTWGQLAVDYITVTH